MAKKWLFSALLIAIAISLAPPAYSQILRPAEPEIAAKAWILIDATTGKVLLERNADEQLPPASLAKMMTTYIVSNEIAAQRLQEDSEVLISDNAWILGGAKTDGSTMFLSPRSEYAFADMMNQQAEILGMRNTEYLNATGLPAAGMVTSARDLGIIASAIIRDHPEYYEIYAKKYFEHNNINQPNRNRLLWRDNSVDGLKTGHTSEAGYCLVSSAKRRGMRLIAVVMGASSDESRARESQKLLSYGFRYYDTKVVYTAGEILKTGAKVWYGAEEFLNLTIAEDVTLTVPRGSEKNLKANILVSDLIKAPVTAGQELGQLHVSLDGETLVDIPLVAEKSISKAGIFSQLFDWIILLFTRLLS